MERHGKLRKHQQRALLVANEFVRGQRHQKVVVAGVTPGGGKTLMASLFANALADGKVIDQALVVVPNAPLREQMREGFHDESRGLERYLSGSMRQAPLPGMGKPFGQVVTYQALSSVVTAKRLASWCAKRRTLVIFDECHHLMDDKAWERGARAVVDTARLVLCMSGTLWRWDDERIPFVNYDANNKAVVDIRYSRAEALMEQAILPVEFRFFDGHAVYEHSKVPHDNLLSKVISKEEARTLKTCLKSEEYARKFLTDSVAEWEHYRSGGYPSQLIVACHDKKSARRADAILKHSHGRHMPVLSVCADPTADKAIKQFRSGQASILTTVRKAYEGLDVPGASHLVYLGDIRSWPFLDQVIARVTRFNRAAPLSWAEQRGYVYAPCDPRMRKYVDNMLEDQGEYFKEKEREEAGERERPTRSSFRPESAEVTSIGFGVDGRCLTEEENIGIRRLKQEMPQLRAPLDNMLVIAESMGYIPRPPGEPDESALDDVETDEPEAAE